MKYISSVRTLDRGKALVTCQGNLGIAAVEELKQAVYPLLSGESISHLVFDLTVANYVSSSALGVMEDALTRLREKRGKVSLVVEDGSWVRQCLEKYSLPWLDFYGTLGEVPMRAAARPSKGKKRWSTNLHRARAARKTDRVRATCVRFAGNALCVFLSDGREIRVPVDHVEWLDWLAKAAPRQRDRWSIESEGSAIYWEDLDDGIEVRHLLGMQPLV